MGRPRSRLAVKTARDFQIAYQAPFLLNYIKKFFLLLKFEDFEVGNLSSATLAWIKVYFLGHEIHTILQNIKCKGGLLFFKRVVSSEIRCSF